MVTLTGGFSNEIRSDKLHHRELCNTGLLKSYPNKNRSFLHVSSSIELDEVPEMQRDRPEVMSFASQAILDGSELNKTAEKDLNILQFSKSSGCESSESQSNQETSFQSIASKEESDNMHPTLTQDNIMHPEQSNQESVGELENEQQRRKVVTGPCSLETLQEESSLSAINEKALCTSPQTLNSDSGVPALHINEGKLILPLRSEKQLDKLPLRRNSGGVIHAVQVDKDGINLSRMPEKPSEDGYNWRKYGQKLVRGNSLVRSYYKCTSSNCPARKQVERSHEGLITEINYMCKHEHPKPPPTPLKGAAYVMPIQARKADGVSLPVSEVNVLLVEDNSSKHGETSNFGNVENPEPLKVAAKDDLVEVTISESSEIRSEVNDDGNPDLKRQKIGSSVNDAVVTKTNYEPRVVVQTRSEVDLVNDGYRWRKYGQKVVKGSPNPRSYYRCSSAGCQVKKHVERAAHDPQVVITTYEGQHDHDIPPARSLTHNVPGPNPISSLAGTVEMKRDSHRSTLTNPGMMSQSSGELGAGPESDEQGRLEMVVYVATEQETPAVELVQG